jgi:hypothetical protein
MSPTAARAQSEAELICFAGRITHYFARSGSLGEEKQLFNIDRLAGIPGVLIPGRFDRAIKSRHEPGRFAGWSSREHGRLVAIIPDLVTAWKRRGVPILDPVSGLERMISALARIPAEDVRPWPD